MLHLIGLAPTADVGRSFITEDLGVARVIAWHTNDGPGLDKPSALEMAIALRFFINNGGVVPIEQQPSLADTKVLADFVRHCGGFIARCENCELAQTETPATVIYATKDYAIALCSTCDGLDGPNGIAIQPLEAPYPAPVFAEGQ